RPPGPRPPPGALAALEGGPGHVADAPPVPEDEPQPRRRHGADGVQFPADDVFRIRRPRPPRRGPAVRPPGALMLKTYIAAKAHGLTVTACHRNYHGSQS